MEGLDLIKKDWQKERNFPKITESEIYQMIHKKSSSIVKWIFVISVLEIIFWVGLNFLLSDDRQREMINAYHLDLFMNVISVVHWLVLVGFVFLFYRNYKNISNTSSVKTLMNSILNVRKIVQYYVWYNVIMALFILIVMWTFIFHYDRELSTILEQATDSGMETGMWVGIVITLIIVAVLMCGALWLFYRIIYGILLKRLYKNYEELKKIEI